MFFTKNEIIELEDKNYLVFNSTIIDNEVYYEVSEVDVEENTLNDKKVYIRAVKESEDLYIEEIQDKEIISKLDESFKS